MSEKPIAIRLEGVSKVFAGPTRTIQALQNFSATIRAGQVTGLIGPDGAGKTTLMRLIAGLLVPDGGEIRVLDQDPSRDALAVQRYLGYMPQRFGLYEDLTVQENLDLYADLQNLPPAERPGRFQQLLAMTALAPFTRRLAGRLSGGMKQKLGLACALLGNPKLLLLDEPTVGVDPLSRRELWQIVHRQVREKSLTVLLSTAYLDEAERCDEVLLLQQGTLIAQGAPASFIQAMRGRSFQVTVPTAMPKRTLVQKLASIPEIADAVLLGNKVRLVTQTPKVPEVFGLKAEPVAPRLEDYFVAALSERRPYHPPDLLDLGRRERGERETVIEVQNLKRRFGDFYAVQDVSFKVYRGEVFGLLGANGAGKTTTFRMLCGLLPVSEGKAYVAGIDLRRAPAKARARIGYMAQRFSLYSQLSVAENLKFFSGVYGLRGSAQRAALRWALEAFGLEPFQHQPSDRLPLGYKQRLALACALLHRPEILFLDEPTSGVDPLARREFWQHIHCLAEQGVTVLVTTHFLQEAEFCDRLVLLQAGKILACGTPEEIRLKAATSENPTPTLEDAFIRLIETAP
ncbi:MAG: ATP-binding cassette domain-containing protein [Methylohalobius sp.]